MRYSPLWISIFLIFLLTGCASTFNRYCENTHFGERPDVQAFIQGLEAQENFNADDLTQLFNQVHVEHAAAKQPFHPFHPTPPMTWARYRAIFLTPMHINTGIRFWHDHQDTLLEAEQKYGVSPETIVGIIGVETDYGKYLGKYRMIDALSTYAFNHPRRARFFQNELKEYLILTRELNIDPLSLYGSYEGAAGLPQFMPSNYRHLAVSKNGKAPDLWHNPDDAILSVANYFHHKGWQPYQPVTLETENCHHASKFGNQCWQIYPNFIVIKRYNNNNFYAMAVYQLGQTIKEKQANY